MDSIAYNQWIDASLLQLCTYVEADEYKGIRLRLSKKDTNRPEFLQGVSEVAAILHFSKGQVCAAMFPRRQRKQGKDVDISYEYRGQRINIEVKCADSTKRLQRLVQAQYTLYTPDSFSSIAEYEEAITSVTTGMDVGVGGNDIAKLTAERGFLNNCSSKFDEVSTEGDLNVILFSLSTLEELDEWRRKFELEDALNNHENIHGVILSSIAHDHLRIIDGGTSCRLKLEDNLNYIIQNKHHPRTIPKDSMQALFDSFPNNTAEINAWYKILRSSPSDPLGVLGMRKLAHYYITNFES